jgi:class 3 adenylate cyclase
MAILDELQVLTGKVFREQWTKREGMVVPEPTDLQLGNDAVVLDATVLYADMASSTQLVDNQKQHLAAEVYKTYLACAARIIKGEGGAITAYDGDRVMAVFIGDSKNTCAGRTALKINWVVSKIINPGLSKQYGDDAYQMKHVVGIDTSTLFVCRVGVRNDNDLVWVGRAANYAAKLCTLQDNYAAYITGSVFDQLHRSAKYGGNPEQLIWEQCSWTSMNNLRIHRSNWIWSLQPGLGCWGKER